MEAALHWSTKILPILNKHLESREWLASSHPTIADCAVFPYLSVAHEGSVDVRPFPALMAWMTRVSRLPNFIPMPGMLTLPY
ncbi:MULTISPECIES: glutathione binding-like protein [Acetobacteraceae]|nr:MULTISPECIES: glutathione binding-like protein [Acetobacteraceae]NVN38701.1 glutathione S-transferase family protein [Komagataeibacter swingsii]BAK86175.1 glutathione S-transferase [Komagataeibacter medellinensis NBRC 3288]NPC90493.1 glutathione S-transferase [Gluconacetobacter entanii]PYD59674.1 glutathione S-transferase [Gluconacetobacter entanii]GBQ51608.1 glutathione S-transferase [Komagataeibacter sucrofermentans DSM 15973]